MQWARTIVQLALVIATTVAGVRLALGLSLSSIETYCPFGGLETAWSLITNQSFSCATGERNLSLFLALLLLTLIARKAFCSWVCPFGTVSEWISALRRWIAAKRGGAAVSSVGFVEPPRWLDRSLRLLRVPVLVVILIFTYRTGELVFRGYDPYYILFSMHGHDVRNVSYAILAGVLGLAFLIPMAWCRYLCPLGVVLWPFAAVGRLRIRRSWSTCTGCGACDRACPQAIEISRPAEVRSGECTLCLECTEACPSPGALELCLEGKRV